MTKKGPKRTRTEEDMRRQQVEASQRYYQKNAEVIKEKSRQRYYANKDKNKIKHLTEKIDKLQKQLDDLIEEEEKNEQN